MKQFKKNFLNIEFLLISILIVVIFPKLFKNIDVVQIPHNILDQRWGNKDFIKLRKNKIKIVIRSIFLQGLLTSDDIIWPKNLIHLVVN